MSSYQNPIYPQMDNIPPTQTATPGYQGYQTPIYPTYQQPFQQTQQQPFQQPFQQPTFPQVGFEGIPLPPVFPPIEQSYIENILRLNKDKIATVYMNFDNSEWGSKVFKGAIEAAGKDHIILRDPVTQMRYLLLTIYLNYITFDEEINYQYPFAAPNIPTPGFQDGTAPPVFNIPNVPPNTQYRKKEQKKEDK